MKTKKDILLHYCKTNILGAYEMAEVDDVVEIGGKRAPCFDDACVDIGKNKTIIRRTMRVGRNVFEVRSVFDSHAESTPTDALLRLIDHDLEKGDCA